MSIDTPTIQKYARTVGILYLFIILAGIFGQIVVRGSLIVPGDGAATVDHILAALSLWRWGIFGDVLMHISDIPVMVLLYLLFRPVHRPLALVALGFNVVQTCVLVANKLTLIAVTVLLGHPAFVAAYAPEQVQQTVLLLLRMHDYGFSLGLIFFGLACVLYGLLLFRSGYFPRTIGILVGLAGISYLASSVTLLLAPKLAAAVAPVLVFSLIGELSFALWLIFKGVKRSGWEAR